MEKIRKLAEAHRFFVEQSPKYMAGADWKFYYRYYPIAYAKFMYYELTAPLSRV